MGMRTNKATGGYQSGGTSSFPTTGFPASAYLGNNRRVGGGSQGQPSPMAGGIGQAMQFNPTHSLIVLIVIIFIGYTLWHMDNK